METAVGFSGGFCHLYATLELTSEAPQKRSVCDGAEAPGHYGMVSAASCWKLMRLQEDGAISASLLLKDKKVPSELSQVSLMDIRGQTRPGCVSLLFFVAFFPNRKASLIPFDLLSHSRDGVFGTCVSTAASSCVSDVFRG